MSTSGTHSTHKDDLELSTLLQQGAAAARVGDTAEAETLFRKAVDEYPYSADAYLALAGVVTDLEEKRSLLQHVQKLNPSSEEARLGLERIAAKIGPSPDDGAASNVEAVLCACGSGRMTVLRCGKCGKPICPNCMVRHPVGLRCKECAAVRKSPIYDVKIRDYLVAGAVGLGLSLVAAIAIRFFGGLAGFFIIIIGLPIGAGIADVMSRSVRMKRGLGMQILAAACLILGVGLSSVLFGGRISFNTITLMFVIAAIIGAVGRLR